MSFQSFVNKLVRPKNAKASSAGPVFAWSQVGRPKWTPRRYDTLAEEGYRKNVVAFRCATLVASAAAAAPWVLYDSHNKEIDQQSVD